MKIDELKVTKKYSSIVPNAETEQAQRDARLGQTVYVGHPDNLIKHLHTCLENHEID